MTWTRQALGAVVIAGLALPGTSQVRADRSRFALVSHDGTPVYALPSQTSRLLTRLPGQSQITVTGSRGRWDRVRVWSGIPAWISAADVLFRRPAPSTSTYRAPVVRSSVLPHPVTPLQARAVATASTHTRGGAEVRAGARLRIRAWRQDAAGRVWYRSERGWVPGDTIQFAAAHAGRNAWKVGAGKGMWLTIGTMADSAPAVLVAAAIRAGMTHLYLETAISPLGFHGKAVVGPLIDAAHRRGLRVIAWVYPYLNDVASDVDLTARVAAFRTGSGQRFDGIAADLERNLLLPRIRAYSQLVRASAGRLPLIAVTYPPQSLPAFPFGEVARQYDAIAPMDYWHDSRSRAGSLYGHMGYGFAYAYRYARDSVGGIRSAGGSVPILPIGQTFDPFGRLGMGPYAPSEAELRGFLQGSRDTGAVGVSFFQWLTASQPEWHAVTRFRF